MAEDGVWDRVRDADADPIVYKSSDSAFWRRKIQISVKMLGTYTYHANFGGNSVDLSVEISAEWVAGGMGGWLAAEFRQ